MGIISLRGSLLIGNNLVPRPTAVTTTFLTNYITSIKVPSRFKPSAHSKLFKIIVAILDDGL